MINFKPLGHLLNYRLLHIVLTHILAAIKISLCPEDQAGRLLPSENSKDS